MGEGYFDVVFEAEAIGIKESGKTSKTVAVKMVREVRNSALKGLISELKVMIYLGSHLNVLNLLGACTKNIRKGNRLTQNYYLNRKIDYYMLRFFVGELLVIVEYCRFGNLQNHLMKNRNNFVNQVDELGNMETGITNDNSRKKLTVILS